MKAKRSKKNKDIETRDYRHSNEKRKNVPLAKIAAEGEVPKLKKARYYYSAHLSPELRFDPEGKADRVMAVKEKVGQYLTKNEKELLDQALNNQQPWLEWAGKKEQYDRGWFEVDPVALHIHERVSAHAIVRAAMREDLQRDLFADPQLPYQKEVQFYQHDVDWANRLILGDSLQVMSSLARRENLGGKVQMIYIDPPYGIKFASNFQPEVRNRNVKEKTEDLTREAEMVKAYRDTWVLGVHSYLSFLRDRLILAKNLLHDSGSIFVQIGEENVHKVRIVLDEIFGPQNFVSQIAVKRPTMARVIIRNTFYYVVWYAKCKQELKANKLYIDREQDELPGFEKKSLGMESLHGFEHRKASVSDKARYKELKDNWRFYQLDNLVGMGGANEDVSMFQLEGKSYKPSTGAWKTTEDGLQRLHNANRLEARGDTLCYKNYLEDLPVVEIANMWEDTAGPNKEVLYVVQTKDIIPLRCMLMSTEPGDLVLDPTCGSGTTACVAEEWGRRWITIDSSRVSIAIARQRLLARAYRFYKLRDEVLGVDGGLEYRSVPHITLRSVAQNANLDPIFEKHESILRHTLEACNQALDEVSDDLRARLKAKLMEKQKVEGKRTITDADQQRWELPKGGEQWQEWEVPFDTDPDWPKPLRETVMAYRKAWRAKMDEVNTCITANADQEKLVDQPEVVSGIVRVSGPFTVEGVRPEELSMGEEGLFDSTPNEWEEGGSVQDVADEVQNVRAYLSRMVELIRKDGITFPNNQHQYFARVEPLYEESTGSLIHAEAIWKGMEEDEPNNIGITLGPQYGPVTAEQVGNIIRAGRHYPELVIAGFSFDAAALDAIQENQHPKQKIHIAHIRPDVSPGMDGLLKDTPNSQLFTVFGQPEVEVKRAKDGEYTVELLGVDIYDPLKGEVRSSKADKVAAWFLDSDYDGRCFCITQAFFPDQNAWGKIAKSLGSQADPEAFEALNGTNSIPFKLGKHKRVAVKVIDPRGNEVMAIAQLDKDDI